MKVLLTGATGLIGKEVGKELVRRGHEVVALARNKDKAALELPFQCTVVEGDLSKGPLGQDGLGDIEGVIHLMGEPVIGRWTEGKKKRIRSSRIDATRNLLSGLGDSLRVFVSGSAIGYYGDCGDDIVSEGREAGTDFLAKVCVDWEEAAQHASARNVQIRTGLVLSSKGGALDKMLLPFRLGVGGVLGSGRQWMSWIHIDDIVGLFVTALENKNMKGPYNGTAPRPVTNEEFSKTLAQSLGKRLGPPVPELALKVIYGEASQALTESVRASAAAAEEARYEFKYPELAEALESICAPLRRGEEIYEAEQFIPEKIEKVFEYFKDAHNLEEITPPSLNFHIQRVSTPQIQQGTLIDYSLKVRGVPVKWKTEIDEWKPPYRFVDNQLKGPYKLWHHTHEFEEVPGGTLMKDRVRFRLPLGTLGLVAIPWVKKEVETIFRYRRQKITSAYAALDKRS